MSDYSFYMRTNLIQVLKKYSDFSKTLLLLIHRGIIFLGVFRETENEASYCNGVSCS